MKSILLHVHDDVGLDARLAVALDLAKAHCGHITCLQTREYQIYTIGAPYAGLYPSTLAIDTLRKTDDRVRSSVEQRLKAEDQLWNWVYADGDPAMELVSYGRLADVLILSRQTSETEDPAPLRIVADVVIDARAPVLAIPPSTTAFYPEKPVVIAWNGSIEVAHSLRLTLPFLRMASKVHLVTVADERLDFPASEASHYLTRQGIPSKIQQLEKTDLSVAQLLQDAAADLDASCILMGAYGHSRLREAVLGGVTRELLAHTDVPLLLAH